jgi:Metal binding domain of Ada
VPRPGRGRAIRCNLFFRLPRLSRVPQKKDFRSYPSRKNHRINMLHHKEVSDTNLRKLIRKNEICFGGNKNLKIYGTLSCKTGKRMKKENRVFFISEKEAVDNNYRPCGHCLAKKYKQWKLNTDN